MRSKLWFGAATAAVLMFAPGALAQQAEPPGDASTTARLGNETIDSQLEAAGDVDWYRMTVEQGQRYSLTLDAAGEGETTFDPTLAIYDAEGNQLAFNDDANGSLNAALSYVPAASGEVFVEVRSFLDQSVGPYRLAASSAELPPDDVGNDVASAGRVNPGRAVNGNIEYNGDGDLYRLSTRTGQRYTITLRGAEGDNALADPYLRLLDRDGNELSSNDDDNESLNSALTYVPQTSGDVFIDARAYADAYSGAYTLNVAADRAPTDNIAAATNTRGRINVGGSVEGALDFERDSDWYRIRLEQGQSYRFTLISSGQNSLGDPLLRLHNANGDELAADDDNGGALNSYLEFTAPSTGNYFLSANAFADASAGGYTLTARAGEVPADASTDAVLSPEGDYREGMLAPAGDRDWYRIELGEGQGMRVTVASVEGADALGDPYVTVRDADGAELALDDDSGDGLNAWLEFVAPSAGVYYVEARGFSEDAAGRYAVSVVPGEVGNSMEGAEYLTPGFEGRTSTIGAAGDADWFLVELIEGRPYRFSLQGVGEDALADPVLTLYDSNGAQVAQDDDGGTGASAYLTFASPTGGAYFAAVSAYGDSATGRYELRAADTDVPGHVYTDETLDSASDDRVSRIDMEGDIDTYRADLEAGVRYVIEVRGQGRAPLADAFAAVVNEAGETLASDDDSGPGLDARLTFTPPTTGAYFIQASGLGGSLGWYQVSIARQ